MKKIRTLSILSILLLFLIAPINNSVAQTPDYVGISEGDEYIWRVKLNSDPIENFLLDLSYSMDDLEADILDLVPVEFKDLTVAESMKYVLNDTLSMVLPPGWNALNISEFCKVTIYDSIEKLNDTLLVGFVQPGWESVNVSTMIKMVIEGLNTTIFSGGIPIGWQSLNFSTLAKNILDAAMPVGWENYTVLETIEFVVNELNSTLFSGIIPSGWEDITIKELMDIAIEEFNTTIFTGLIPVGWEDLKIPIFLEHLFPMIPHEIMKQLVMTIYIEDGTDLTDLTISSLMEQLFQTPTWDQITTHELLGMMINATIFPNFEKYNLSFYFDDLIYRLNESGIASLNMSDYIDFVVYGWNSTFQGLFSTDFADLNMSTLIDEGIDILIDLVNGSGLGEVMPLDWQGFSMDELIDFGIDQYILMLNSSTEISLIIPGWEDLTITELIQNAFDLYIVDMVNQYISEIYQWLSMYTGYFQVTYGIKLKVNEIGTETILYPDGPSGVPINITLSFNFEGMPEWIELNPQIEGLLMDTNITWSPVIYDQSTFPNYIKTFTEQAFATGLLIIGTNYDWAVINNSMSYDLPYDLKVVDIDFRWNSKGVLSYGAVKYANQAIFSIQLKGKEEELIPGYEIPILIGIGSICAIIIISYIRKKKYTIS